MSAAAITVGLNLAATYLPDVIVLVKHILQKDKTTITVATVIAKLDASDVAFADNLKADAAWFAEHNMVEVDNTPPTDPSIVASAPKPDPNVP